MIMVVKVLVMCVLLTMISGCAEEMKCNEDGKALEVKRRRVPTIKEEHIETNIEYEGHEPLVVRCNSDEIVKILLKHQDGNYYLIDVRNGDVKKIGDLSVNIDTNRIISRKEVIINKMGEE